MAEIIPLNDIYVMLCSSKPTLYKAILSLIQSSGMTTTNLSRLTLNDFLNACVEYFDKNEEKTFENLLNKDPWNIIPCWKLKNDKKITFNTPETTFHIFMYLKEKRQKDFDDLNNPLFKSGNNNFLKANKISSYITEFNKILNYEKGYFKSKNLIKTFENICKQHLNLEQNYKTDVINLFIKGNVKYYKQFNNNYSEIKQYYKRLIPFLTARTFDFDKQINAYKKFLDNENINYELINDYFYNNLKDKYDLDYTQELLLCKFALEISKTISFKDTPNYLKKLFKKAFIRLKLFKNQPNSDEIYFSEYDFLDERIDMVKKIILDINALNLINYNIEIEKNISKHIINNDFYEGNVSILQVNNLIENILFELIDNSKL